MKTPTWRIASSGPTPALDVECVHTSFTETVCLAASHYLKMYIFLSSAFCDVFSLLCHMTANPLLSHWYQDSFIFAKTDFSPLIYTVHTTKYSKFFAYMRVLCTMCAKPCMYRSDNLRELVFPFHHVGPGEPTQAIRLGGSCLLLLSHHVILR